ncbi:MAG: hypothetical protein ACKO3M_12815 [Rubrivivax sp.]
MSPYAQSLLNRIAQAQTALEAAKAEVLLGCYWARVGDIPRAEEIRADSRSKYPSGQFGELTVLHMCLDGLIHYYSEQSPAAAERLRGAHALAATYRFRDEQAFSGAWLAHIEFNRDRWKAMAEALDSCHASMDPRDLAVGGRFALVIADALSHSGVIDLSRQWYEHARVLLTSIGDHAAIEAYLYNGAALRLHAARLAAIKQPLDASSLRTLGGEIDSAANYQRLTAQKSLDYLLDLAKASHRMLSDDFNGAASLLMGLLEPNVVPKGSSSMPLILADIAVCNSVSFGAQADALSALAVAKAAITTDMSPDDFALAAHSISLASDVTGDFEQAAVWMRRRDEALQIFEESRGRLREAVSKWAVAPATVFAGSRQ